MVSRVRLLSKFYILASLTMLFAACGDGNSNGARKAMNYHVDTTAIPKDTLMANDAKVSLVNGLYVVAGKPFFGIIKELYANRRAKAYRSIYNGMLHGNYRSYYPDGKPFEVRMYKNNLSTGRHYGYWPDGKTLKFDYNYYEEKRQGPQKKWYKNGSPYLFANYKDDHEDGLQQGWRENGKLFLNYVARDGHTYGLQQTALCYTLINQKLKPAAADSLP